MTGTTASTITALSAHREWATRPPDERYASVHALYEAARARRLGTVERRIDTGALGTTAVTDDVLALRDHAGGTAPLTHWSFDQLATIAGAPPKYLRSLPASIASAAINHGLSRAASRAAPAVRRRRRTGHRARDHLAALHTGPPRRAGQPGARPHGLASRLASAARLSGRRLRGCTRSIRRVPGRSRSVSLPRGREPGSRRPDRPVTVRAVSRVHPPEQ